MIITYIHPCFCSEYLTQMYIHPQKREKLDYVTMSCQSVKCGQFNKKIEIKVERASSHE